MTGLGDAEGPRSGDGAGPDIGCWVTLDAGALAHNVGVFRHLLGSATGLGCVIKGNAYGHGLRECLPTLHAAADVLYAITAQEALLVRAWEAAHGRERREVVVIGPISAREAVRLAAADVAVVVADPGFGGTAAAIRAAGVVLRVHVHLDTGLSREGLLPDRVDEGLAWLADAGSEIRVEGVLTHFADVEDVTEQAWAREQLRKYDQGLEAVRQVLDRLGRPTRLVRHTAASAAALVLPESRFDVARVGVSTYGLWPSRETRISTQLVHGHLPELQPVLTWRCRSQLVKTLPAGSYVSYGCTHRCGPETRIAVLPVGYFDGYPRLLSGRAHVLVHGRRCPVLGRVMMNHVVVDVTDVPGLADGDEVVATLLGADGDERVTADDLAGWAQTISYEIVTRIAEHVPRELAGA